MRNLFIAVALMLSMSAGAQERATVYFTEDISPEALVSKRVLSMSTSLSSLTSGTYIINGKKTLIK